VVDAGTLVSCVVVIVVVIILYLLFYIAWFVCGLIGLGWFVGYCLLLMLFTDLLFIRGYVLCCVDVG